MCLLLQDFVRPLLHRYGEGPGSLGRARTLPHIKSYCLYSTTQSSASSSSSSSSSSAAIHIDYVLLTSANLSMAAWGQLQNCDKPGATELKILSYELGVLFLPQDQLSSGALVQLTQGGAAVLGKRVCPLPFQLPSNAFGHYDEPWTCDGRFSEPDGFGRQWPCHIELYGPNSTSSQGIAPPM